MTVSIHDIADFAFIRMMERRDAENYWESPYFHNTRQIAFELNWMGFHV